MAAVEAELERRAAAATQTRGRKGWHAALQLQIAATDRRTVVARRAHVGPFCIQQPFYAEDGTCHIYLLHPPGGLAGGDRLELDVEIETGAAAVLTTPASTKFYRTLGMPASQEQRLRIAPGASLEWLPQDTILFGGSRAVTTTLIDLHADSKFIGWEVASLGRPRSGDHFAEGRLEQNIRLQIDGEPLLLERFAFDATDVLLDAYFGLASRRVWGSMYIYPADDDVLGLVRSVLGQESAGSAAATRLGRLIVLRALGEGPAALLELFRRVWTGVREHTLGRPAVAPRIWST